MRPNSDLTSPYTCSKCDYKATTRRDMLQHSNNRHEDPLSLVFTDNTGREVKVGDLFHMVGRCKAPGCGAVFANNDTRESQLYSNVRRHWWSRHSEQPERRDKDKVEILLGRIVTRTVKCEAGGCKWTQETGKCYWMKKCLDHFLLNHGDDLTQLGFRDSEARSLRIRDLYFHVGRCSAPGCGHVFGSNNTRESELYNDVRRHWRRRHREQPEREDKDKVEILLRRTETRTVECEA